jgi:ABC-type transporter Mla MlaB component
MHPLPTLSVDVAGLKADAATVDALARLALKLRRRGYQIRLRRASPELLELIEFAGLSDTLAAEGFRRDSTEPRC